MAKKKRKFLPFFPVWGITLIILGLLIFNKNFLLRLIIPTQDTKHYQQTPVPSPTPSPTPKPLTFAEMNALYGPCVYLPVLMYHHVQDLNLAKEKKQTSISVGIDVFRTQMQYLKNKGYTTVSVNNLINFFDNGVAIPKKTIIITFDDGYDDFYFNVLPILREFGFQAVVFLPTGLMGNPGYLNWAQISEATSAGISFANHTWSHKSVKVDQAVTEKEISLADSQLNERGLNSAKIFAYPYGFSNGPAESFLQKLGYSLAFTTRSGSVLCKKQRLNLPRIRIGNVSLSTHGF